MSVSIPVPLSTYFAAKNAFDIDGMLACFADDAVVRDERKDMVGHPAIRAWMAETTRKYRVKVVPTAVRAEADKTIVAAQVSGNFPGSPAELHYEFALADGKIARLSIG